MYRYPTWCVRSTSVPVPHSGGSGSNEPHSFRVGCAGNVSDVRISHGTVVIHIHADTPRRTRKLNQHTTRRVVVGRVVVRRNTTQDDRPGFTPCVPLSLSRVSVCGGCAVMGVDDRHSSVPHFHQRPSAGVPTSLSLGRGFSLYKYDVPCIY